MCTHHGISPCEYNLKPRVFVPYCAWLDETLVKGNEELGTRVWLAENRWEYDNNSLRMLRILHFSRRGLQRSQFLVLTKRSAAYGDKNVLVCNFFTATWYRAVDKIDFIQLEFVNIVVPVLLRQSFNNDGKLTNQQNVSFAKTEGNHINSVPQENFPLNPLQTKLVRSRWLDIGPNFRIRSFGDL